ncbi:MAG TPA: hypothetical protein VMZ51_08830 [Acidimicrobiales bacterium]|nr:hypothetical protein [Acidimicrobiales bacterium]
MTGAAGADPSKGETFPVTCDNGHSYVAVSNGNGLFTPAHDTASNATFVPVSFGAFTATVTDADGNVVASFTDPGESKGQSAKGVKDPVNCTFSFTEVSDGSDPDFPAGYTFTGSGSAVVRITPSR